MLAPTDLIAAFKDSLANAAHDWRVVAVADSGTTETFEAGTVCLFSKPLAMQATAVIGVANVLTLMSSPAGFDDEALADTLVAMADAWQQAQASAALAKLTATA
jgi:hypothetical protein